MQHDRMRKSLCHLGVDDSNFRVLKLLPLVYVAWNSGRLSPEREQRLVDLAHNHFAIGAAGERILRGWLEQRPGLDYFQEGLHDLLLLAHAPDEFEFDTDELPSLLAFSEAIARTTADAMDAPTSVTPGEEAALADIARELGVDEGETWAALIRELRDTPKTAQRSQLTSPIVEPVYVQPEPVRLEGKSTRAPALSQQLFVAEEEFPVCSTGDGQALSSCKKQRPMHSCDRRLARRHYRGEE